MLRSFAGLGLALLFSIAGCASANESVGSSDENATSAEDVEVAHLRNAMAAATGLYDSTTTQGQRARLTSALVFGSANADLMQNQWTCSRRGAGRDDLPNATISHFEFSEGGDETHAEAKNTGDGYGGHFIHDVSSRDLIGYAADFTSGGLQHYQVVRTDDQGLVMEEVLRSGVGMSPDEQQRWQVAQTKYETAVTARGLAIAYTRCSTHALAIKHLPVGFSDDFTDQELTGWAWNLDSSYVQQGSLKLDWRGLGVFDDFTERYSHPIATANVDGGFDHVSVTMGQLPRVDFLRIKIGALSFKVSRTGVLTWESDAHSPTLAVTANVPLDFAFAQGQVVIQHGSSSVTINIAAAVAPMTGSVQLSLEEDDIYGGEDSALVTRLEVNHL